MSLAASCWNAWSEQVKRLSLAGSGLTDAGIKHLAGLTNLEWLNLRNTKASAAGVAELQKAQPKCKIERDGKKDKPGRIGGRIYRSLDDYANQTGVGEAFPDNVGYAVPILPSGRESFAPDASWHKGPFPKDPMRFIEGAATFSAEVRSDTDYGPTAESEMAEKRADYFQAGTLVVWDVPRGCRSHEVHLPTSSQAAAEVHGPTGSPAGWWVAAHCPL